MGMVKNGRRQDWDGVVHNVCMVHKDSMHEWVNDDGILAWPLLTEPMT